MSATRFQSLLPPLSCVYDNWPHSCVGSHGRGTAVTCVRKYQKLLLSLYRLRKNLSWSSITLLWMNVCFLTGVVLFYSRSCLSGHFLSDQSGHWCCYLNGTTPVNFWPVLFFFFYSSCFYETFIFNFDTLQIRAATIE